MTNAIAKIWQELAEVSASLSCAKNKLTSKLDEVVANIEETDKTKKAFKDTMFDTRKEAERSKDKIAEVQDLIQGLQMRISEIDDLAAPISEYETAKETSHNDELSTNIVAEET
ncbi:hypothetical protein M758_4G170900 [Ceratodon purpureus]|uniref:DUF1664 domain-containing protein n=1 Tax=Ceratodon purpureus TaxID=3225 RepID=A0A8T0I9M4_CERPU|nr:hypothetical protein KC19_4G169300 [Ceratodon purpureus]KAG0619867.1 hypothetical protein M758_4G170900 [Ceratodon purpureus]